MTRDWSGATVVSDFHRGLNGLDVSWRFSYPRLTQQYESRKLNCTSRFISFAVESEKLCTLDFSFSSIRFDEITESDPALSGWLQLRARVVTYGSCSGSSQEGPASGTLHEHALKPHCTEVHPIRSCGQ